MEQKEMIQSVLDEIETLLTASFSVEELAEQSGYSTVQFCRLFRSFVGVTPMAYIRQRRLLYAVYDMHNGLSGVQAALKYGYDSYAGFYKSFRRTFGCSPSAFSCYHVAKPYPVNLMQEEYKMIAKTKLRAILQNWNLQDADIVDCFYETTGQRRENTYLVDKDAYFYVTNRQSVVQNMVRLHQACGADTQQLPNMIQTRDGNRFVRDGELYFYLVKRTNGAPVSAKELLRQPKLAFDVGRKMAMMHREMQSLSDNDVCKTDLFQSSIQLCPLLQTLGLMNQRELADFQIRCAALQNKLPQQWIHRNLNPSNLLFREQQVIGFLDFSLMEYNFRLFDLCYCATAVLSEFFPLDANEASAWLSFLKQLLDGYASIGTLTAQEWQAVPDMILVIQLVCIHHFSRLEKYRSLTERNIAMTAWLLHDALPRFFSDFPLPA